MKEKIYIFTMELKYATYSENDDKANEMHEAFSFFIMHFNRLLYFININENFSFSCIVMSISEV